MAQVPTIGRIVHYHHSGDGLVDGLPRDYPAMILEVSGGPIDSGDNDDTGEQTDSVVSDPYVCMLEVFRPRGTEWKRCSEGDGVGGWSWPPMTGGPNPQIAALEQRIVALEEMVTPTFLVRDND